MSVVLEPKSWPDCAWRLLVSDLLIEPITDFEFAVFNPQFSDSFLFNAIDAALASLLLAANGRAVGQAALVAEVAEALELPNDERLFNYVQQALDQMAYVGLICRDRAA
jgi:hypothetical protein